MVKSSKTQKLEDLSLSPILFQTSKAQILKNSKPLYVKIKFKNSKCSKIQLPGTIDTPSFKYFKSSNSQKLKNSKNMPTNLSNIKHSMLQP